MDRERFDALARRIGTTQTRRTALGILLAAPLLGIRPGAAMAGRHRNQNHKHHRKHDRKQQRRRRDDDNRPCFKGASCLPGQGRDNSGCDFSNATQFFEGDFQGANLSRANFTGAQLAGANLQGADLGGACLVGATMLGATIDASTNLEGAIFCRTLMPNGTTNDSGCGKGTRCCPTPKICRTCQGSNCLDTPNTICSMPFGTPCCTGMQCTPTATIFVTSCQRPCNSDQDCIDAFGPGVKCCAGQSLVCPFFPGQRCCQQPGLLTC